MTYGIRNSTYLNEIINYCKQYRIGVFCDDINKVLTFKPLSSYFNNYKVLDWTDKLDLSKDITYNLLLLIINICCLTMRNTIQS